MEPVSNIIKCWTKVYLKGSERGEKPGARQQKTEEKKNHVELDENISVCAEVPMKFQGFTC